MNCQLNERGLVAIEQACCFLVAGQEHDGFWRDYILPPGASGDWVTAFVGFALLGVRPNSIYTEAATLALGSLQMNCRPTGWGYNTVVATDADTTSWVVRAFVRAKIALPLEPISCLVNYLGPEGGAKTFNCGARYGCWIDEHPDVTAVLGLAMKEAGASVFNINLLRKWLLRQRNENGVWSSFWWTFDAYATARSLEFLAQTGGIPGDVMADCRRYLERRTDFTSAMETANLLIIALLVDTCPQTWTATLLDHQCSNGGWPPSKVLKVPSQMASIREFGVFEDVSGLMSTAMSVMALTGFLKNKGNYAGS